MEQWLDKRDYIRLQQRIWFIEGCQTNITITASDGRVEHDDSYVFAHFLTLCEIEKRDILPFLILSSPGYVGKQRLCKADTFD